MAQLEQLGEFTADNKKYGVFTDDVAGLREIQSDIVNETGYTVTGTYTLTNHLEVESALEEIENDPKLTYLSWRRLSNGGVVYDNIKSTFSYPGFFGEHVQILADKRIEPQLSILLGQVLNGASVQVLLDYAENEELIPVQERLQELRDAFPSVDTSDLNKLKSIVDEMAELQRKIDAKQHFDAYTLKWYYSFILDLIEICELDDYGEKVGPAISLLTYKRNKEQQ